MNTQNSTPTRPSAPLLRRPWRRGVSLVCATLGLAILPLLTACGDGGATSSKAAPLIDPGDGGNYAPVLDAAKFVPRITNEYLPFKPGAHWVYLSVDGAERIEITVLEETRTILGIQATIVRDTVTQDGALVEDTFDWYAQDSDGNVWYLGEDSKEYKDGKVVSTAGSWEAGVNGAKPGFAMLARHTAGRAYRQEFDAGNAEDIAKILETGATAATELKQYDLVVVIQEWAPLDPKVLENKSYAPGVGLVLEEKVVGGEGRVELQSFEPGR